MGSQLFYTYTSSTGSSYLAQSQEAIVNNSTYTYSLVFDENRRTIWTHDKEYGGMMKIDKTDANLQSTIQNIQENGIKILTYEGVPAYFYVNSNGAMSVFKCCRIAEFDVYNGNNCSTGTKVIPQQVTGANYLDKFKITLEGTDITNVSLKSDIDITTNNTNSKFPTTSGFAVAVTTNSTEPFSYIYDVNSSNTHNGVGGQQINVTLTVTDSIGHTEEKTINVITFNHIFYIYVGSSTPTSEQILQYNNNEGIEVVPIYQDTIPHSANENNDYFFVIVPSIYTVTMEQGGGIAEWHSTIETITINSIQYKIYRTPRTNVSGASYKLYINE